MSRQINVKVLVGQRFPVRSGGELYNSHLFQAAEDEGLSLSFATLSEAPFEQCLARRLIWRLKAVTRCFYMSRQAWHTESPLWIDVWLAPYLWPWALLSRHRCLLMVHHLRAHLEPSLLKRYWLGWCERRLIRQAAHILTVSQSSYRQICTQQSLPLTIRVINPGFERPEVKSVAHRVGTTTQFLYVGHLTRAKGIVDLAMALRELPADDSWHMHIVGNMAAEPGTIQQVQELLVGMRSSQVTLHGRVDDASLQRLYAQADVFVLPSHWEGYGIVFLEAMARGLPVISTTAGAIPEVVCDKQTGLLVAPGDVQALAAALQKLLQDNDLRQNLGQAAYAAAMQHADWPQMQTECRDWWHGLKQANALSMED